jgi:hypothetical protein
MIELYTDIPPEQLAMLAGEDLRGNQNPSHRSYIHIAVRHLRYPSILHPTQVH